MLENENMIDLFDALKGMSSEQLSQLIQEETAKESPNDDLVLMALNTLEDREKEEPVKLGPKGKAAWKKYQSKVRSRQRKTVLNRKPVMQVASVLLIITMLFALLPTRANAETWWERLARWTDDFFSFFNPNDLESQQDGYVFQTDNEGLQKVYDAVVELGVREPVVPMWLPEKYELVECQTSVTPIKKFVYARLSNNNKDFVIQITALNSNQNVNYYYKDDTDVEAFEQYGIVFSIIHNEKNVAVIWTVDNIECAFSIDCQDDILYEIIDSIYRWRINK